jgi:hypothetical protein
VRKLACAVLWLALPAAALASDPQWTTPTAQELSMTSIPEVPGAAAVYLYREENTVGSDNAIYTYVRIKILNESGKEYANVELPFGGAYDVDFDKISGRTIHSDGTIIPFAGKPFEKFIEKDQGHKYKVKIFSLPSVEVGSIVEYRYRRSGPYTPIPDWYLQSRLFVRKAHFSWRPGVHTYPIAFTPVLPPGAQVQQGDKGGFQFWLDVENIAPQPKEDMMPPLGSLSYRVLFYYTRFKSEQEYWKAEGDFWATGTNEFITPGKGIRAAVAALTAAGDSDDTKLRKIYAKIMTMENTDFSRQLTTREAKAQGQKEIKTIDDILARGSGTSRGLTDLFVSMARAAGMKAYVMRVADRSERLFFRPYLDIDQATDYIAIVELAGVETYFDPGERYCPYGHLVWFHSVAGGVRQTETGSALANTPPPIYKDNHVLRVADMKLDEHGAVTGKIRLTYNGDPARSWRQRALLGDDTSLKADLRSELEELLPTGMEISVDSIGDLTHPEVPLIVDFEVHGTVGSSTGKRLLVPANLFAVNEKPRFPSEKRELSVDLHTGSFTQDAVRYQLSPGLAVESAPAPDKGELRGSAIFNTSSTADRNAITLFRNVSLARIVYTHTEYPELRSFYQKLEAKDQESLVLTKLDTSTKPAGSN